MVLPQPTIATMTNQIAALRSAKGWSQGRLAREADTSRQQIHKLEHGIRRLTPVWAGRLAAALGCDIVDLDPDSPPPPDVRRDLLRQSIVKGLEFLESERLHLSPADTAAFVIALHDLMRDRNGDFDNTDVKTVIRTIEAVRATSRF